MYVSFSQVSFAVVCVRECVCVCARVCERERERWPERAGDSGDVDVLTP